MPRLSFTRNLVRHTEAPTASVDGSTVRAAFEDYFARFPAVRGYVLDDQGAVRHHVAVFLNRELMEDRKTLSDPVQDGDEIFVIQALSGG